jgi:predicted acetyltransferase
VSHYGVYRSGVLRGAMRLFDFTLNMRGQLIRAGGIGFVVVDFNYKKRGVARDLVRGALQHFRAHNTALASLYPFRPDFYHQMGFGYGTKLHSYRIRPAHLPASGAREHVRLLHIDDRDAVAACYERYTRATHGMMLKSRADVDRLFEVGENRLLGYVQDGELRGYLVFQFRKGETFIQNDIEIREFIAEDRAAFLGLLAAIQSQDDQVRNVILHVQDEYFHTLLADPRNGTGHLTPHAFHETNTSGVGLMYRVVDLAGLFGALAQADFGGQSCRLRIDLHDSFLPEQSGALVVHFAEGRATVVPAGDYDVSISLPVAECSSLLMGVLPFSRLHRYGLAEISDARAIPLLDRLFGSIEPPVCVTRF